jgi:hypothetical protein
MGGLLYKYYKNKSGLAVIKQLLLLYLLLLLKHLNRLQEEPRPGEIYVGILYL